MFFVHKGEGFPVCSLIRVPWGESLGPLPFMFPIPGAAPLHAPCSWVGLPGLLPLIIPVPKENFWGASLLVPRSWEGSPGVLGMNTSLYISCPGSSGPLLFLPCSRGVCYLTTLPCFCCMNLDFLFPVVAFALTLLQVSYSSYGIHQVFRSFAPSHLLFLPCFTVCSYTRVFITHLSTSYMPSLLYSGSNNTSSLHT